MESERTRSPSVDQPSAGCVGCGEPVSTARCEHCGVAVAPGGWKLKRQLAKTPHSRVFLAEKTGLRGGNAETVQRVALKELLFALVPDAQQLESFEREARMLKQLNHPSIPKLVENFREGSGVHTRLYLAQEFVPGASLLQELEDHRFSEPEVKSIARTMLETLEYLHGLSPRVIHRDIKPANIMRREDRSLALVDFGAARDLTRGATHGSTLVGTFGYMPPEQLGGTVDLSSDLYALGASLLHLLSRKPPDELLKPGMELSFGEEINVSPGFRAWLEKMVARNPANRFRTARSAREALDDAGRVEVRREVTARPLPERSGASSWRIWAVGGVALFSLMASGWLVARSPQRPAPVNPPVQSQPVQLPAQPLRPSEPSPPPSSPASSNELQRPVNRPPPLSSPPTLRKSGQVMVQTTVEPVRQQEPLPPFTVEKPVVMPFEVVVPISSDSCPGGEATFGIHGVKALPGRLEFWTQFKSGDTAPGCLSVYVELLDQRGGRDLSRTTLLRSAANSSAPMRQSGFSLPENSQRVQLRFGPQAKPLKVLDVDLAKGTVTPR